MYSLLSTPPQRKKDALQQRLLTKYSWPIQKTHVNSELLYFMLKMTQPTAQHLISSSPPTPNPHYEQGTRPYFSLHWKNGTIYSSRVEGCNTFFDFWKPTQFCRSRMYIFRSLITKNQQFRPCALHPQQSFHFQKSQGPQLIYFCFAENFIIQQRTIAKNKIRN